MLHELASMTPYLTNGDAGEGSFAKFVYVVTLPALTEYSFTLVHSSGANTASSAYAEVLTTTAYPSFSKSSVPTPANALVGGAPIVSISDVLYPDVYMLNDRKKRLDAP
ncbi:hypothetical protein GN958_ATG19959 [Phytophthora infestans]|uniref:Uncharacterized protein n=1 Tax=Phytophthora infestans TaxID=4787 RepID=A0A8S9TQT4_PHYIN|nr:hypothetical protein GN958_ATG20715 [Phytophthora infestans]KAF4130850.1 hypothetical protein GN958_ATG19959 [Phytophthora infestans]KAI9981786.1 hypothetical protein PInf_009556 [Phytophthora infestans]